MLDSKETIPCEAASYLALIIVYILYIICKVDDWLRLML